MSLRARGEIYDIEATQTFIFLVQTVGGCDEDRLQAEEGVAFSLVTKDKHYLILNLFCRLPGCQEGSVQTNVRGSVFISSGSKRLVLNPQLPESRPSPSRMMCDRDLTPEGYTLISSLNLSLQAQKPAVVSGVPPEASFSVQINKVRKVLAWKNNNM